MVYIELTDKTPERVYYDYMPESQDAERGSISVDRHTLEWRLERVSPASSWSEYYFKAAARAAQLVSSNDNRKLAYAAFY